MSDIEPTKGGVVVELDDDEAALLRNLLDEMRILLEADIPRVDPVVSRLFPDAYEDPQDSEKYRDLIGDQLRAAKLEALRSVTDDLGAKGAARMELGQERLDSWLTLLTDMRLAIGTRLDIDESRMEAPLDPEDPETPALSVLHWLGWLQGSTLEAMTEGD